MSELNGTPDAFPEGQAPEATLVAETPTEQEPVSEIEQKARNLGWRPQTEYNGMNFVEPDEYVRRQPLFERIDRQKKELEETKTIAKQAMEHLIAMRKESYESSIRNLEQNKLNAVENGNTQQYRQVEAQQQGLRNAQAQDPIINQPRPAPMKDPVISDFEERNKSWYNNNTAENRKMIAAAEAVDSYLVKQAAIDQGITEQQLKAGVMPRMDVKQHLQNVESRIKSEFQHRFTTNERTMPNSVGKSTQTSAPVQTSALVAKMTPDQLQIAKYWEKKSDGKITLDMYAKELETSKRLGVK